MPCVERFREALYYRRVCVGYCLHTGGLLVLNFACRSPSLYEATVARMKEVFDAVFEVLVSKEDCNVVLFAIRGGSESLVPTTLAGAEHFLLQRAEKDGSSPLLRSVREEAAEFLHCDVFFINILGGWEASSWSYRSAVVMYVCRSLSASPWASDLLFGAYVSRIQTQVGGAFGLLTPELQGSSVASGDDASAPNKKNMNKKKKKKNTKKKKKR